MVSLSFQKKPTLWTPRLQTSLLLNGENISQLFSATHLVRICCHGPRKPLVPTKGHILHQLPKKVSVGGQSKDSVKSSNECDTSREWSLSIRHREPAVFRAGDPRKKSISAQHTLYSTCSFFEINIYFAALGSQLYHSGLVALRHAGI